MPAEQCLLALYRLLNRALYEYNEHCVLITGKQKQYLIVKLMDLNRNYSSNIQPPTQIRASNLINHVIKIASASTPIRKRIVKPSTQMNSTPVSVPKIEGPKKLVGASNKENNEGNVKQSKLSFKKPRLSQKSINLSPIMALNRKMSQGPRLQERSLTPNTMRRQQSSHFQTSQNSECQYYNKDSTLGQDIRSSNCFQQIRCKTPTRLNESQQSSTNLGFLRSNSANSLISGISNNMSQSRGTLRSSTNEFKSFKGAANSLNRAYELVCINEHQKKAKAKYKVIEESDQDDEILVYCSRCAILLVKKGFKVEELTPEDINRIIRNQKMNASDIQNQYQNYAEQALEKFSIKQQQIKSQREAMLSVHAKALKDIQCYYNSIIAFIQEQKKRDCKQINQLKQEDVNSGEVFQSQLTHSINKLGHMLSTRMSENNLESIRSIESILTAKSSYAYRLDKNPLNDNIEPKFNEFARKFNTYFKLSLEEEQGEEDSSAINYHNVPTRTEAEPQIARDRHCPLRFSFQKNLRSGKSHEFKGICHIQDPGEEIQEMQGEQSVQLETNFQQKAFRTLFPEQMTDEKPGENGQTGIYSPTFKQF